MFYTRPYGAMFNFYPMKMAGKLRPPSFNFCSHESMIAVDLSGVRR